MNLSIRAEHIDAAVVGFGLLWAGTHLVTALVCKRKRRRRLAT